jgi:hypothetical protein
MDPHDECTTFAAQKPVSTTATESQQSRVGTQDETRAPTHTAYGMVATFQGNDPSDLGVSALPGFTALRTDRRDTIGTNNMVFFEQILGLPSDIFVPKAQVSEVMKRIPRGGTGSIVTTYARPVENVDKIVVTHGGFESGKTYDPNAGYSVDPSLMKTFDYQHKVKVEVYATEETENEGEEADAPIGQA